MAGRPLEAMALLGIGFRKLSMAPSSIGPVKEMIRSLSINKLKKFLDNRQDITENSLREKLRDFASNHNVKI